MPTAFAGTSPSSAGTLYLPLEPPERKGFCTEPEKPGSDGSAPGPRWHVRGAGHAVLFPSDCRAAFPRFALPAALAAEPGRIADSGTAQPWQAALLPIGGTLHQLGGSFSSRGAAPGPWFSVHLRAGSWQCSNAVSLRFDARPQATGPPLAELCEAPVNSNPPNSSAATARTDAGELRKPLPSRMEVLTHIAGLTCTWTSAPGRSILLC